MAIDNKQQARRMVEEVWNKGNFEVAKELMDASYQGTDPVSGKLDRDGFIELIKGYRAAFPDLKFEILQCFGEGNFVCTRWRAKGTHRGQLMNFKPTGKVAEVTGVDIAEYRNGKMVSDATEWDSAGLMRQLGLEGGASPDVGARQQQQSQQGAQPRH